MVKVGLSPSKKLFCLLPLTPLENDKNAFYFILKALFVHEIFTFCLEFFARQKKRLD